MNKTYEPRRTAPGFNSLSKKPRRVCRPQAANEMQSIFCRGVYLAKNSSQSASVEFVRFQRTNYARGRLQAFCPKRALPFLDSLKRMNPGAVRRGSYVLREVRNETGSVGFSGRTAPSYGGCAGPGPAWPRRAADATASCRSGCRGRWCGGADPAPDSPASGPQTAGPRSSCRPG